MFCFLRLIAKLSSLRCVILLASLSLALVVSYVWKVTLGSIHSHQRFIPTGQLQLHEDGGSACSLQNSVRRQPGLLQKRFNFSTPVFQSEESFTEPAYERLSNFAPPYGWKGIPKAVVSSTLGYLNSTSNKLLVEQRKPCMRCAVVGNGGILRGSGQGPDIDGHDLVFRDMLGLSQDLNALNAELALHVVAEQHDAIGMHRPALELDHRIRLCGPENNGEDDLPLGGKFIFSGPRVNGAVTKGFEYDVGTRTSFYGFTVNTLKHSLMLYRQDGFTSVPQGPETRYIFIPSNLRDYVMIASAVQRQTVPEGVDQSDRPSTYFGSSPREHFRMLHPDFISYLTERFLKSPQLTNNRTRHLYMPSTGALMLFAALHTCDQVSAYGFITSNYAAFSDHYYDTVNTPLRFYANHDLKMEGRLWEALHKQKIIHLYTRDL